MSIEKKLTKLHDLLCEELTKRLKNGEGADPVSPSTLNVIRQFLRDNNIDGALAENDGLQDLLRELPEDLKNAYTKSEH